MGEEEDDDVEVEVVMLCCELSASSDSEYVYALPNWSSIENQQQQHQHCPDNETMDGEQVPLLFKSNQTQLTALTAHGWATILRRFTTCTINYLFFVKPTWNVCI